MNATSAQPAQPAQPDQPAQPEQQAQTPDASRSQRTGHRLTPLWMVVVVVLTALGVLLTMNQVFFWNIGGLAVLTNSFLYLVLACFLPVLFLTAPARRTEPADAAERTDLDAGDPPVAWYDVALCVLTIAVCGYFAWNGVTIKEYGWEFVAPLPATVASFALWGIVLEALRRAAGLIVTVVAALFSVYPLFAAEVPFSFLQGITYDVTTLAQVHAMGPESILGLPMQTAGTILIGFLLFGVVLQHTGGADFFYRLSMALFGRFRGGSAKVAVASSAAMGMMSGSAVSNVLTTGPMTIPAMKRDGFSPTVAGGVEATASSGGSITPPIMGTAAFLMVAFVGVPYTQILVAATIPAILYFLGIYLQIDGYAARRGLRGTPKEQLPAFGRSLLQGWPYVASLALLTVLLFVTRSETQAPYYVIAFLLVMAAVLPGIRFGRHEVRELAIDAGRTLSQIIGIIAGIGLILGGLTATGVSLSLARDMVALVGDNAVLLLIAGAVACFILGMGMTISAAYVFLAIVMVPAVVQLGINPIAAHLFVIYWASVSYITPPVGLAGFAAAGIAKAPAMATCVAAMRLGAVKYVVPFGFALNPALVGQAPLPAVLLAFALSLVAVFAIAGAMEGWILGVDGQMPLLVRIVLGVGGFLLFLQQGWMIAAGLAAVAGALAVGRFTRRTRDELVRAGDERTTE